MQKTGITGIVLTPDRVNIVTAEEQAELFDYEKYVPKNIHICIPRPHEKVFKKEMRKKPTPTWRFQDSIFAPYKRLTEDLIVECFEFDWNTMTKPRFKEGVAIEPIKSNLRKAYPYL